MRLSPIILDAWSGLGFGRSFNQSLAFHFDQNNEPIRILLEMVAVL